MDVHLKMRDNTLVSLKGIETRRIARQNWSTELISFFLFSCHSLHNLLVLKTESFLILKLETVQHADGFAMKRDDE